MNKLTSMDYREIRPQDIPTLFEIRVATWHNKNGAEEMQKLGITSASVGAMLESNTHRGWICDVDGKSVGFAMGNRETGEMWVIAVLPQHEGKGIGRGLLTLVENWLFGEGWEEIWLTTDVDESLRAVGFYRNLGWEDWKFEDGDRFMRKRACATSQHAPISNRRL